MIQAVILSGRVIRRRGRAQEPGPGVGPLAACEADGDTQGRRHLSHGVLAVARTSHRVLARVVRTHRRALGTREPPGDSRPSRRAAAATSDDRTDVIDRTARGDAHEIRFGTFRTAVNMGASGIIDGQDRGTADPIP